MLSRVFTEASGRMFDLYDVEHVFWFHGGNPYGGTKPVDIKGGDGEEETKPGPERGLTPFSCPS